MSSVVPHFERGDELDFSRLNEESPEENHDLASRRYTCC